jgi:transposase-like protein
MPVLSHVHQLFNADQCQAYIRTLRWKDRPLQCPRCQSHHIGYWGTYHYRPGCTRYWCHRCKRTFNDLTEVLEHAGGVSQTTGYTLFSIGLALNAADARIPRRLTRNDQAAVNALVKELSRLKYELEGMLSHLKDWAESRVAMATNGHADDTLQRTSAT